MILGLKVTLVQQICRLASFLHVTKYGVCLGKPNIFQTLDKLGNIYTSSKLEPRWYIYLFLTFLLCLQYICKESLSLEETVLFWICFLANANFLCYLYVHETKPREITLYINSFFKFDAIYGSSVSKRSKESFQTKMSLVWVKCAIVTAVVFPIFFVYGVHWTNPCKVSLLGFWLLEKCNIEPNFIKMVPNVLVKAVVFLINHWMWVFGLQGALLGGLVISTMTMICMHEFIERLAESKAFFL